MGGGLQSAKAPLVMDKRQATPHYQSLSRGLALPYDRLNMPLDLDQAEPLAPRT
jgi:hypothetical protein